MFFHERKIKSSTYIYEIIELCLIGGKTSEHTFGHTTFKMSYILHKCNECGREKETRNISKI